MEKKIELLSPVGSPEALQAALRGGADAVYMGGTMLNARMKAKNFDDLQMERAVRDCHRAGVKAYVTMNTLVYDREMESGLRYAAKLYDMGVDALIVADLGFARLLSAYLPQFPLHASTQAGVHSTAGARFMAEHGFCRAVCARELKKEDIFRMAEDSPIGIEIFIHGAMCVCHSGQCLFSSMVGGRSGNRGECAQPCRMAYQNGSYPLSLRDMCLANHISEILCSRVESLKIEGRMKSPDYVYRVTNIYRRLLCEGRNADRKELGELQEIFSRSGFSDGYFTSEISQSMLGIRRESDVQQTRQAKTVQKEASHTLPEITVTRVPALLPTKEELGAYLRQDRFYKTKSFTRSARFEHPKQVAGADFFDIIYLPLSRFDGSVANGVILDPVMTDGEYERAERLLRQAKEQGARYLLVCNVGQLEWAKQFGMILQGDFRLNAVNNLSASLYGLERMILSPEMTLPQIRDIGQKKSVIVYGRIPLMVVEKPIGQAELRDRTRAVFPVLTGQNGERDRIVNSVITYMDDRLQKLQDLNIADLHYIFTVESRTQAEMAIERCRRHIEPKDQVRRIK